MESVLASAETRNRCLLAIAFQKEEIHQIILQIHAEQPDEQPEEHSEEEDLTVLEARLVSPNPLSADGARSNVSYWFDEEAVPTSAHVVQQVNANAEVFYSSLLRPRTNSQLHSLPQSQLSSPRMTARTRDATDSEEALSREGSSYGGGAYDAENHHRDSSSGSGGGSIPEREVATHSMLLNCDDDLGHEPIATATSVTAGGGGGGDGGGGAGFVVPTPIGWGQVTLDVVGTAPAIAASSASSPPNTSRSSNT